MQSNAKDRLDKQKLINNEFKPTKRSQTPKLVTQSSRKEIRTNNSSSFIKNFQSIKNDELKVYNRNRLSFRVMGCRSGPMNQSDRAKMNGNNRQRMQSIGSRIKAIITSEKNVLAHKENILKKREQYLKLNAAGERRMKARESERVNLKVTASRLKL